MFRKMLLGALIRQRKKLAMIAFTVALGVSLATAMLNVMFDVGDKVNQELKAYGANLNIVPKGTSLMNEIYDLDETQTTKHYINEEELLKIKMIFWAYNIVDFTPFLDAVVTLHGEPVTLTGTWFDKHLVIPTGDEVDTGILAMKPWWNIEGELPKDENLTGVMVGQSLAKRFNLKLGDMIEVTMPEQNSTVNLMITSILNSGGEDDQRLFVSLPIAQQLTGQVELVERVEVSALTTPENDLARRAAEDPNSLSRSEWDTWYCTAYISSIAYQLEEVIPDVRVKAIMQVAESEGSILQKTQLLMLLLTALSLICSALAISNLVTANVIERSAEIGLLKALGATNFSVSLLILTEILITAFIGGIIGYFIGLGFAQIIGHSVFGSAVEIKELVIPLIIILILLITIIGSLPAIRMLMSLRPTEVLHGR